jgi:hypothetical protein
MENVLPLEFLVFERLYDGQPRTSSGSSTRGIPQKEEPLGSSSLLRNRSLLSSRFNLSLSDDCGKHGHIHTNPTVARQPRLINSKLSIIML